MNLLLYLWAWIVYVYVSITGAMAPIRLPTFMAEAAWYVGNTLGMACSWLYPECSSDVVTTIEYLLGLLVFLVVILIVKTLMRR